MPIDRHNLDAIRSGGRAGNPNPLRGDLRQSVDVGDRVKNGVIAGNRKPGHGITKTSTLRDYVVNLAVVRKNVDGYLGLFQKVCQVVFNR